MKKKNNGSSVTSTRAQWAFDARGDAVMALVVVLVVAIAGTAIVIGEPAKVAAWGLIVPVIVAAARFRVVPALGTALLCAGVAALLEFEAALVGEPDLASVIAHAVVFMVVAVVVRALVAAVPGHVLERIERTRFGSTIRQALESGQMSLVFQPVISAESGHAASVEALLRWQHPHRGNIPPSSFMPLAEASGAAIEVGAFVVEQAVAQLSEWQTLVQHMGGAFHVAINVSGTELRPELADLIAGAMERHGVASDQLMLEVTEATLAAGGASAERSLKALDERGIGVAVADLGTGYANWRALHEPAVRRVKIDRTLVAGCTDSIEDAATIARVIELAHEMDLEVVAEGVETQRQHDILRNAGVDCFQGWFFGRPARAVEVEERLWSEITRRRTDLVITG